MFVVDAFITISPFLGLYSQYALMKQTKTVGSFSIDYCAILIFSSILRICFWFTTGFANNLLIQSFFMIAVQIVLLDICIKLGYKSTQQQGLWRWNTLRPFLICITLFSLVVGLITAFFMWMQVEEYGKLVGLAALSIEAVAGFPLLISNQRSRSVEGLSVFMVITWFVCDFLKTLYFIIQKQPFQFILCGAVQLTVDVLVIIQIMVFKEDNISYLQVKEQAKGPQLAQQINKK